MPFLAALCVQGRVDTPIAERAPHGTGRAAFPHPALYGTYYSTPIRRYSRRFWLCKWIRIS